jgi:hypothetical protein
LFDRGGFSLEHLRRDVEAVRTGATSSVCDYLLFLTTRFWYGVPLFFVISGYCISASVDRHRQRASSVKTYLSATFPTHLPNSVGVPGRRHSADGSGRSFRPLADER